MLGPAHYGPNRYAGGAESGLSEGMGPRLLKEMRRLNVALDCTHQCDQSFWEAVRLYDGPVLASLQNCRALVPLQYQFSDEPLKVIIERDGVIGAAFDIIMVRHGWQPASTIGNLTAQLGHHRRSAEDGWAAGRAWLPIHDQMIVSYSSTPSAR